MKFVEKLLQASRKNNSLLCVGLDPDPELMSKVKLLDFLREIIQATSDLVCAYKPNLAFYEALGLEGLATLKKMLEFIPTEIPVIGDAKRGDIGNSSRKYARALFDWFGFDAVTVNPYLGEDSLRPFLEYADRGVFVLCLTSNPGASDFQAFGGELRLFELVARKAKEWNARGNVGLVVGATQVEGLRRVRELCPEMPLLIPGVGAQRGDLESAVRYGGEKTIINSSRGILYASRGGDFASAARREAQRLRDEINRIRYGDKGR